MQVACFSRRSSSHACSRHGMSRQSRAHHYTSMSLSCSHQTPRKKRVSPSTHRLELRDRRAGPRVHRPRCSSEMLFAFPSPLTRGGLPSRRAWTSIPPPPPPPRISPPATPHQFVQDAPQSTYQKPSDSLQSWLGVPCSKHDTVKNESRRRPVCLMT